MAGTIPISMTQQFDIYGQPLAGGQLYLIQAGTVSTPQNGFQDPALTIPMPNPIPLDAAGRIPQFFLADGFIKVRLQDAHGVVQLSSDGIQVIGPSSGGGGGSTVDGTTIFVTGDMKARFDTGVHPTPVGGVSPGWVRANGLTIGSTTSGATERAAADCQALYIFLWGVDSSLAVSGGRGASGLADWTANKQLSLPDWRGYNISALDDMGNAPANRLGPYFTNATTLGAAGGNPSWVFVTANLPPYTPSGSITNGGITTTVSPGNILASTGLVQVGGGGSFFSYSLNNLTATSTQAASFFNGSAQGGTSTPFPTLSPRRLCTVYIKL